MSDLSWNWYWDDRSGGSWESYLRNRDIVAALNGGSRASAEFLSSCMTANTREIVGSIDSLEAVMGGGFRTIGRVLLEGFVATNSNLDQGIHALGRELADMGTQITGAFTWGFSAMLAAQGGMQTSLDQLVKLAKTPAQTAAYEQFEIARDAFRQGLYVESLEALDRAILGVPGVSPGYRLEWRFHQLKGLILLGSHDNPDPKVIDPAMAEESFVLAARYAHKDSPQDAAKALLSAGWSAYIQGSSAKLVEALAHTERAAALDPQLGEAIFQAAKFYMALGNPDSALPRLEKAAEFGSHYIAKAAADGDFKKYEVKLVQFLTSLLADKVRQLRDVLSPIAEKIASLMKENEEISKNEIAQRIISMSQGAPNALLIDVIEYLRSVLQQDVQELKKRLFMVVRTSAEELDEEVVEHVPTGAVRIVRRTRTVNVEESYQEEVVVRPGGLFRKEVREKVTKTRLVPVEQAYISKEPVTQEVRRKLMGPMTRQVRIVDGTGAVRHHYRTVLVQPNRFVFVDGIRTREIEYPTLEVFCTPVTQELYESVMGSNPSSFKDEGSPVDCIGLVDAAIFCNELSKAAGLPPAHWIEGRAIGGVSGPGWFVPFDDMWEYVCRASSNLGRDGSLDEIAWYRDNSGDQIHPVGKKAPNEWGIFDMLGNVWEWTRTYHPRGIAPPLDHRDSDKYFLAGGCFSNEAHEVNASSRIVLPAGSIRRGVGFRPMRFFSE